MLNGNDDLGREFSRSSLSVPLGQEFEDGWQRIRWNGAALALLFCVPGGAAPLIGAFVLGEALVLPVIGLLPTTVAAVAAVLGYRRRRGGYILGSIGLTVGWGLLGLALRAM
ncbi:hypothetical protein [Streptomyces daliensis]|uniref:Uncharacterized protein n=1 Tax=Streptomyces daliensis TaxID=299421 RepID=A0A8T4IXX9_9ACTN|nr:hypothetical protein [Streptomyces daliensis]